MDYYGTSLTVFFEDPFWIGDSKKGKKTTEVNDFAFPDTLIPWSSATVFFYQPTKFRLNSKQKNLLIEPVHIL